MRRRSARWRAALSLAAAGLGLAGCFLFRRQLPPREFYRLSVAEVLERVEPRNGGTAVLDAAIAVAPYITSGLYGEPNIVYRLDENEYGAYPLSEWALPLSEMVGVLTEAVLTREQLTSAQVLYDPPSRRAQPFIWRGTVRQFEEVNRNDSVFAAVRLDAQLIRSPGDSVLWSGSAAVERHVPGRRPRMSTIVEALSEMATTAVVRLASDARATIALKPPPQAPPPD